MSAAKIVKRYANRKLYDTERSCYVTLEDIAIMIKAGEEVRVVDNKSGEDLTSVTLAQIIFETEKKASFMPLGMLRDIIQNGGEKIQAATLDLTEKAQKIKGDIEGRFERLTTRKHEKITEADDSATVQQKLTDLVTSSRQAFDELQRGVKGVEERVKGSVGAVSRYATLGRDMEEIRQRLASLEERLGKLQ